MPIRAPVAIFRKKGEKFHDNLAQASNLALPIGCQRIEEPNGFKKTHALSDFRNKASFEISTLKLSHISLTAGLYALNLRGFKNL